MKIFNCWKDTQNLNLLPRLVISESCWRMAWGFWNQIQWRNADVFFSLHCSPLAKGMSMSCYVAVWIGGAKRKFPTEKKRSLVNSPKMFFQLHTTARHSLLSPVLTLTAQDESSYLFHSSGYTSYSIKAKIKQLEVKWASVLVITEVESAVWSNQFQDDFFSNLRDLGQKYYRNKETMVVLWNVGIWLTELLKSNWFIDIWPRNKSFLL